MSYGTRPLVGRDEVLIVAGLGRCGSSLVMQMLSAIGVRVTGEWPAFEDNKFADRDLPGSVWRLYGGSAVKWLDPQQFHAEPDCKCSVIWLDRSVQEQVKSQLKFLRWVGHDAVDESRQVRRGLARSIRRDRASALARLGDLWLVRPVLMLSFEGLLNGRDVVRLGSFLQLAPERVADMARMVHPRSAACYPKMLEEALAGLGGSTR